MEICPPQMDENFQIKRKFFDSFRTAKIWGKRGEAIVNCFSCPPPFLGKDATGTEGDASQDTGPDGALGQPSAATFVGVCAICANVIGLHVDCFGA